MAWRRSSKPALLACGLTLSVSARASAQTNELPVVSYVAPAECATADAFQLLVATEVAREPDPNRPWRFAVTIRREGDYIATLETERGTRAIHASTCNEVTAALATIIAMAQPQVPAASRPPPLPTPRTPATELLDEGAPPDEAYAQREAIDQLDRLLDAMDESLRAVFVLYEIEEQTMAQIAETLELAPGTVASRLRRARARFEELCAALRQGGS